MLGRNRLVLSGTADSASVRCLCRGVSRTLKQRERTIRFWLELDDDDPLPSPEEAERSFME